MKDINDRNLSFWSPHPFFIAAFFLPLQLFQLAWLWRLYRLDSKKPNERKELDQMVDYVPYFSLGNVCLGVWMVFWNSEHLKISNLFVLINGLTQLFYMYVRLPNMNTRSTTSILTNVVCRAFAGIAVLDLLHNGSIAYFKDVEANTTVKVVTAVVFSSLSAASDWIFGGCMVYDLVAIAAGQSGGWRTLLGAYALGAACIVCVKNIAR